MTEVEVYQKLVSEYQNLVRKMTAEHYALVSRLRREIEELRDEKNWCDGCGVNRVEEGYHLYPGCQAYKEHQS